MFLFGPIGPTELILILLIVLILFGGRKLGDLGKSLGEGIKNFKKSVGGGEDKAAKDQEKKDGPPAN
jgi:sec-independent protein translocase protein TatA